MEWEKAKVDLNLKSTGGLSEDYVMKHFKRHHSKIIVNQRELNKKFGSSIKDFQIISELGRGSFGVVYKVYAL